MPVEVSASQPAVPTVTNRATGKPASSQPAVATVSNTATLTPASIHPAVATVNNTATANPASSATGLVNSATGTVVSVIYDNADSTALIAGM